VTSESESNDGAPPSGSGDASHDVLGDTQLGRSLKELIKEIGKEKEALKQGLASSQAPGTGSQEDDDFDPSQTRFDQALELAASDTGEPQAGAAEESDHDRHQEAGRKRESQMDAEPVGE
jgi:hypothetical protein